MILKYGSKSNSKQAVRALSLFLLGKALDTYTAALRDAVKKYQTLHGLDVDGIVGPKTLEILCSQLPDVAYKDYSGSVAVRMVQAIVGTTIDGMFGKDTRKNVIAFQASAGIEQTGNVDMNTWRAMWELPYSRNQASESFVKKKPVDYKQGDSRWGKIVYTSCGNKNQTIANSGCGPTSMADIVATMKDSSVTPPVLCTYAVKHGYRTRNSGTSWSFFKAIASEYKFSKFVQTKSMATLKAALDSGAYAVASMGPGYWTKGGHFICVWKYDATYMYANDPASSVRKKQKHAAFESQRKQFFIFFK